MGRSVLVVAAHPDDEVLGCGGTIARLSQEDNDVYIAVLGEGATARFPDRDQANHSLVETLQDNCRQAADVLGAKEVSFHDLPDNRFDTVPLLEVTKLVEDLVERLSPEVIYTHHGGDLNIDHVIVHRAVLTATRPMQGQPVRDIYAFEVASSTEWAFQQFEPHFQPNTFVDIGSTIETKIKAMKRYVSEVRPFPHPRSLEALNAMASRWGSVVGVSHAEAFQLIRSVR